MFHKLSTLVRRKRKLWVALFLILVAGVGPYLVSRVRSPGRRVEIHSQSETFLREEVDAIRLATFNIAHGRGATGGNWGGDGPSKRARIQQIANLIREMQADVVVLNEVDFNSTWSGHQNQAAAIAQAAGFAYWVEQRNLDFRFLYGSWKFGNAILSKFPIEEARVVELARFRAWENWLAGCKRSVVCTIQLSPENRIRLMAVHLEHRSELIRVESARRIAKLANAAVPPLIVAGDFNSSPPAHQHSSTTTADENAMRVLVQAANFKMLPITLPQATDMTYSSIQPHQVIDWILIPQSCEFVDYAVINSELSDHRPVVATIRFHK